MIVKTSLILWRNAPTVCPKRNLNQAASFCTYMKGKHLHSIIIVATIKSIQQSLKLCDDKEILQLNNIDTS